MNAQTREHLDKANVVRIARSKMRRDIHDGLVTIPEALGLDCARSMLVINLLEAQKLIGPRRAVQIMASVPMGPLKIVQDLTCRQRDALVAAVSSTRREQP